MTESKNSINVKVFYDGRTCAEDMFVKLIRKRVMNNSSAIDTEGKTLYNTVGANNFMDSSLSQRKES